MGLDSVELVMAVEEYFDIQIPDPVSEKLYTVGLLHEHVTSELRRLGREQNADAVFTSLQQLICKQLVVKPEQVTPNARFVQDLGIS
jgi:acyl carrier protein